jgi:hypothetical protein
MDYFRTGGIIAEMMVCVNILDKIHNNYLIAIINHPKSKVERQKPIRQGFYLTLSFELIYRIFMI